MAKTFRLAGSWMILLVATWLLLVSVSLAKPTSSDQAHRLVHNWLTREKRPLGAILGQKIKRLQTFRDAAGSDLYFVVYLDPEGFVIVSGDDLVQPIIAFAPHGVFDPSENNPLGALVSRDVPRRLTEAREAEDQARVEGIPFPRGRHLKNRQKWESLAREPLAATGALSAGLPGVSDLRVAPLIESRWDQEDAPPGSGLLCYNYYTPQNYPCGCVATAMAQIMRYFQWPATGVGTPFFTIYINYARQPEKLLGGDLSGGPYNWGLMPLIPDTSNSLAQRQAIGVLTHDAGVAVGMAYSASGSGAFPSDARDALVNTFGYANAAWGTSMSTIPTASLTPMINPNLDAGLPVLLGIYLGTTSGHAIVADGYGFDGANLYHHLNLGWSGTADAWYNLPTINTPYYDFNETGDCIYNIFPSGTGEIISGRVLDSKGNPITGATVTATRTEGEKYTASTTPRGIYALTGIPAASTYTLTATCQGYGTQTQTVSTGTSQNSSTDTGNRWGVDFTLGALLAPPGNKALTAILELLLND